MLVVALLLATALASTTTMTLDADVYMTKNIYGETLQSCQQAGTASTGFTRDGHCSWIPGDHGAHQVCVDMPAEFSSKTGQGHWSDAYEGQPWCICVWAWTGWIAQNEEHAVARCDATVAMVLDETWATPHLRGGQTRENYYTAMKELCHQCYDGIVDPTLRGLCEEYKNGFTEYRLERAVGYQHSRLFQPWLIE